MGLLGIILLILLFVSIKTFYEKPNHNNQIEQSIADVRNLFYDLNQNYQKKGVNI